MPARKVLPLKLLLRPGWRTIALALLLVACSDDSAISQDETTASFVASRKGEVYYWAGCRAWRDIPVGNRRWFATSEEAEQAGYRQSTANGCAGPRAAELPPGLSCTIERVVDGDTIICAEGRQRVRLLLVDAPELSQAEFGEDSMQALARLIPAGSQTRLELDVQERDQYGRVLAYVHRRDGLHVNAEMARLGFVVPVVYAPNVRRIDEIRAAAEDARKARRGLWASSGFDCSPADFRASRCRTRGQ